MIDRDRLRLRYAAMSAVGATPQGGVSRLALSREDVSARRLYAGWLEEAGLQVRLDDLGNMYGRLDGARPDLEPVVTGSHLDSVAEGGAFDGQCGMLVSLEAVASIVDRGIRPLRSIEVVDFTNEEGARFEVPMLASGVLAGVFPDGVVETLADRDGTTFGAALDAAGVRGDRAHRLGPFRAFIEVHIEQGPTLDDADLPLGIVTGIQGLSWHEIVIEGEADHAGPTPMATRRDALVGAAKVISLLDDWILDLGSGSVTIGRATASPGLVNVVPGRVELTMDLRHPDEQVLRWRVGEAKRLIHALGAARGLKTDVRDGPFMTPVAFDADLIDRLAVVSDAHGLSTARLISGAGHDSQYLARLGPTAMLFVRSIGGRSHCPEEHSRMEDIEAAAAVLHDLLVDLAMEPGREAEQG